MPDHLPQVTEDRKLSNYNLYTLHVLGPPIRACTV